MKLDGPLLELFQAFQTVGKLAAVNERLLSCPNLAKDPSNGAILDWHLRKKLPPPVRAWEFIGIILRYFAANFGHLAFMLLTRFFVAVLGWKAPAFKPTADPGDEAGRRFIIDTFALLPKLAQEGRFQEMYLPGLSEAAREKKMLPVRIYRLYGSRSPLLLWRALSVLAQAGPGMTDVHLLRARDWLALAVHIAAYPFALAALIRRLSTHETNAPLALIRRCLMRTAGQCVLSGESRRLAGLRLGQRIMAATGTKRTMPTRLVSWHENQVVNKTFYRGIRQSGAQANGLCFLLGAQLFIWPSALLNNHADQEEVARGLSPDLTLVNGAYFLPETKLAGYGLGPSLRYAFLFEKETNRALKSLAGQTARHKKTLLVLLSYHPEVTRKILRLVSALDKNAWRLLYKFHPATNWTDYARLLPEQPEKTSAPLREAVLAADAVIGAGSGSLAEAVCLGAPVLLAASEADLQNGYNYLPHFGKDQLWAAVDHPEDLAENLNTLCRFHSSPDYAPTLSALTAMLFTPLDQQAMHALLGHDESYGD